MKVLNLVLDDLTLERQKKEFQLELTLNDEKLSVEEKIKKDPDQRNYIVSNEKIEKTGFKPKYSLSDGISELIKGYAMLKNQSFGNF